MTNVAVPGFDIATRARRRWMVLALYASYLAIGAVFSWVKVLAAIPALFCLLSLYAVRRSTRRYVVHPFRRRIPATPDEREERVRDRAMARSYQIASGLLIFVFNWLSAVANGVHWWHPATPAQWWFVYWGVMLLVLTLPQAVISWIEPGSWSPETDEARAAALPEGVV